MTDISTSAFASLQSDVAHGNTPCYLAAGVLGGKLVAITRWPNPLDGLERYRRRRPDSPCRLRARAHRRGTGVS